MDRVTVLHQVRQLGYTITITKIDDIKYVEFNGRCATEPYKLPNCWSSDFSNHYIEIECLSELMRWAGLEVTPLVTYKT